MCDPFVECTTIAFTCMKVFRKNFLRGRNRITSPGRYTYKDNHSHKALQWLVWTECKLGHPIIHAGRDREYRIAGMARPSMDITKSNQWTRRCVTCYNCFWHVVPTVTKLIMEGNLYLGRHTKIQSMLDTNELSQWHGVFDNVDIEWWRNGSMNLHEKNARIARCTIFSKTIC